MKPMNVLDAVALEDAALTADELARACAVQTVWVVERVQSGLLGSVATTTTTTAVAELRFHSPALTRARRLRALERDFDANPELAALAVDMIEEVERLKRQLAALR